MSHALRSMRSYCSDAAMHHALELTSMLQPDEYSSRQQVVCAILVARSERSGSECPMTVACLVVSAMASPDTAQSRFLDSTACRGAA